MQSSKAKALRLAWERKGNPSCQHPHLDKEYNLGMDMGDYVCTTCGRTDRREVLEAEQQPSWCPSRNR